MTDFPTPEHTLTDEGAAAVVAHLQALIGADLANELNQVTGDDQCN